MCKLLRSTNGAVEIADKMKVNWFFCLLFIVGLRARSTSRNLYVCVCVVRAEAFNIAAKKNATFNNIKIHIHLQPDGGQQMSYEICATVANKKVNGKMI